MPLFGCEITGTSCRIYCGKFSKFAHAEDVVTSGTAYCLSWIKRQNKTQHRLRYSVHVHLLQVSQSPRSVPKNSFPFEKKSTRVHNIVCWVLTVLWVDAAEFVLLFVIQLMHNVFVCLWSSEATAVKSVWFWAFVKECVQCYCHSLGDVNKDVFATWLCNKSKSFWFIEKFYGSFLHFVDV